MLLQGIWLAPGGQVAGVPRETWSILQANRPLAEIKLQEWAEAESDCSEAISFNGQNVRAQHRRAMAHYEMELGYMVEGALQDVEHILRALPGDWRAGEAAELKREIEAKPRASKDTASDVGGEF